MRAIRRQSASKRKLMKLSAVCLAALAVLVAGIYYGAKYLEGSGNTEAYGSLEGRFVEEKPIAYQGKQYKRNTGIRSYLIMGIDQVDDEVGLPGEFRSGGQCDYMMLMVIDTEHKLVRRIQIDRDTMAEITILGVLGNNLGTNTLQICLAHGFGDGKEQSCGFAVEAVQRLFYGVPVDGYFSLNMLGIEAFNDLLGGVTVTLEDDFSMLDPAMVAGATVTLRGHQAELFVRSRMSVGDGTNVSRMRRQQQFLGNAMEMAAEKARDDAGFIGTLFDGLKDYSITDISRGKMINEANKAASYQTESTLTIPGEHVIGENGFTEFHADQEALMQMVLDVFYDPVV